MDNERYHNLLRENGLVLPEPGDHYVFKTKWFMHRWIDKLDGKCCHPGDVIFIKSVDMTNNTCSAILLANNGHYLADDLSFVDLMIFTQKLEMIAAV